MHLRFSLSLRLRCSLVIAETLSTLLLHLLVDTEKRAHRKKVLFDLWQHIFMTKTSKTVSHDEFICLLKILENFASSISPRSGKYAEGIGTIEKHL
jgi:hypothetical protein